MLIEAPRGEGGFGYDPAFVPDDTGDERTMSELSQAEKNEISHRGRAARLLAAAPRRRGCAPAAMIRTKSGAAALSIASNALLIAIKLAAGAITGSIAILTEAVHSLIDLVASVVAFVSVRKADEPADADHPYGHEKVESLAATIEGLLILVGAGIIIYEATHRLVVGAVVDELGIGIAVMGFSVVANLVVSAVLSRQAKAHESPALEGDAAHLRTDAMTSAGVLVGLAVVEITGNAAFDSITALIVAGAIVSAGIRIVTALLRRAGRRSAARRGDGRDRGGDRRRPHTRGRRLPQAARPPCRQPPLHRPPRPVPLRHQPRARPRARPRDARLDRGHDPRRRGDDPRRARDLPARPGASFRSGPFRAG